MKIFISFFLVFIGLGVANVFSQNDSIQILDPSHFNRVMQLNKESVVVDLRAKKEFKKGHIMGAHLAIDSKELYRLIDSLGTSRVYLLYCKYGDRSIDAGRLINEKYKISVCSLDGGLDFWLESGFGLE
ncbi:hypothetical protein BZG02_09410 [Labilibaculum filiforme]|uniref:Rhodanese domain-containing protein n=1 Tax=Labilibaculum filiforme TaxID=1940526 RepID=A0A2N3HZS8_9BACT|nr:rhodanese-like domain-containing protein [Labilibaculum filiforme]PKQ63575.1 hypothetical protein BZG02_09410 [Labilibaculum filiforme]